MEGLTAVTRAGEYSTHGVKHRMLTIFSRFVPHASRGSYSYSQALSLIQLD